MLVLLDCFRDVDPVKKWYIMLVLEFVIMEKVDRLAHQFENDNLCTNLMKNRQAICYASPGACLVNIHDMNIFI
jgi:hypothetical protein